MPTPLANQQSDIFCDSQQQRYFAEICNALYERELIKLSQLNISNISLLQRKLGGLRHHVKRAAFHFLNHQGPLKVDVHNASWQAKQAPKCMAAKQEPIKAVAWFSAHARLGLSVPVHVSVMGVEHIELDSIDRIDEHRLHLNKYGWHQLDGQPVSPRDAESGNQTSGLLQPTKAVMSAACCGHTWNHTGRAQPRAPSLRELLLSGAINWKTFR